MARERRTHLHHTLATLCLVCFMLAKKKISFSFFCYLALIFFKFSSVCCYFEYLNFPEKIVFRFCTIREATESSGTVQVPFCFSSHLFSPTHYNQAKNSKQVLVFVVVTHTQVDGCWPKKSNCSVGLSSTRRWRAQFPCR